MRISRHELLNNLNMALRVAREHQCEPLLDNVNSLMSWVNQGGENRIFKQQYDLLDEQETIYLRMMARAVSDDPNNVELD